MTGAELRDLRRAMDLTQAQLARALGLSLENGTKTVYRWETGRQEVPGPAALAVRFLANRCGYTDFSELCMAAALLHDWAVKEARGSGDK